MKASLLTLIVLAALVLPATASANYTLSLDDPASLAIGPGTHDSIAVEYTAFCVPSVGCPNGQDVNSANNAIEFDNTTGGTCTQNSAILATAFRCPGITTTRVVGTGNADSVKALCEGVQSSLLFQAGAGDDVVTGGGCTGSVVDLGPGADRGVVSGTVNGGSGSDVLIPGPGTSANTIQGGPGVDTVSYENRSAAQPVAVTLNGQSDDGQAGVDLVAADVENATGGAGADTIVGNEGSNVLQGGDGADTIDGRGGLDFIDAGPGDDVVRARDGAQDRVACGDGNDSAVVDAFDSVDGCESVDSSRALMPDVDADGVPAPADCADLDAARRPGFRDVPGNGVDEDCSGADAPFARVLTSLQNLSSAGAVTRFLVLKLRGVPERATVEMRCAGGRSKGCFSGVKRFRFPRGKDTADIRRPVRRTRFRPGSRLEVRILAPESVGKVVRFSVRRNKLPRQQVLCLTPGQKAPGRCG
jgi:hypothetical protein